MTKWEVYPIVSFRTIENHINVKNSKILLVEKIGVDKDYRRNGYGRILINEIKKKAKKENCNRIELTCWSFNKNAIKFYEKMGMKVQKSTMEMKV